MRENSVRVPIGATALRKLTNASVNDKHRLLVSSFFAFALFNAGVRPSLGMHLVVLQKTQGNCPRVSFVARGGRNIEAERSKRQAPHFPERIEPAGKYHAPSRNVYRSPRPTGPQLGKQLS